MTDVNIFSPIIEQKRLEQVVSEGSNLFGVTKDQFLKYMITDFLRAFTSGFYGDAMMMIAVQKYFRDIENELRD